ncbi:hypothetical protein [Desulfonatronovibrio magnus]|uniref:hypothetical protein n=1 Tax=Desulfonatronovibrio magnus TaxID=698827 RepID=UPI0012F713ED|nr:hypothetical protein [Desulfonatronovibrio magnus]
MNQDFFKNLKWFTRRLQESGQERRVQSYIVYGGESSQKRSDAHVLPWTRVWEVM